MVRRIVKESMENIEFPRIYDNILDEVSNLNDLSKRTDNEENKRLIREAANEIRLTIEDLNNELEDNGYF